MNTKQDAYVKYSIASNGAGSPALVATEVTTTWKGKYDAANTAFTTASAGLAANNANDDKWMVTTGKFSAASGERVPGYGLASVALEKARAGEKAAESNYKDYEKRVMVHKREMDNQKYLETELAKEWTTWTATLGNVAGVSAATGLRLAKATATALKTSTKDTYDKATTGTVALELAARSAWTGKVTLAKGTASTVKAEFDAVMLAR